MPVGEPVRRHQLCCPLHQVEVVEAAIVLELCSGMAVKSSGTCSCASNPLTLTPQPRKAIPPSLDRPRRPAAQAEGEPEPQQECGQTVRPNEHPKGLHAVLPQGLDV
jgi:hypothetical protein